MEVQEKQLSPRARIWFSFAVFISVILILSLFMKRQPVLEYHFSDDGFRVTAASGYELAVDWDQIEKVEIADEMDLGTLVDGNDTGKEKSGIWSNAEYGDYTLCIDTGVQKYLVLRTPGGTIVLNFESEDSTEQLAEAFRQMMSQTGTTAE